MKANNLPYKDIHSSGVEFIILELNERITGCIGIEKYGKDGLLRSLAVKDEYKDNGFGKRLINELLSKVKSEGIKNLHLLTTTADKYFAKYGFRS